MKIGNYGLLTWVAVLVLAGTAQADPHSEGLTLGKSNLGKLSSNVNSSNAKAMPFYTDKPPQSSEFGGSSLFNVGTARINTCKTEPDGPDQIANQECDAVNFLAKNPYEKVKVDVDENDPIISGIGEIINNAKPGEITENCGTKTTTTPNIYATEVCNSYNLSENKSCAMGQIVNVDTKANFQCNTTKNAIENVTCDKYLAVACPNTPAYCDAGGINAETIGKSTGTAVASFTPPYLDFYQMIHTVNTRETSTFTFNITDISLIGMFKLVYIQQDNWLALIINGKFVRVFRAQLSEQLATSATKLEIVTSNGRPYVDIGVGQLFDVEPHLYPLELNLDMDMRPYLKTGKNTVEFILANGKSYGIGETKFEIRQFCQPCTETWTDQCSPFEART